MRKNSIRIWHPGLLFSTVGYGWKGDLGKEAQSWLAAEKRVGVVKEGPESALPAFRSGKRTDRSVTHNRAYPRAFNGPTLNGDNYHDEPHS